jgi:hypothetical protein
MFSLAPHHTTPHHTTDYCYRTHPDTAIAEAAGDIAVAIATRSLRWVGSGVHSGGSKEHSGSGDSSTSSSNRGTDRGPGDGAAAAGGSGAVGDGSGAVSGVGFVDSFGDSAEMGEIKNDLQDPLLPVRAHALGALRKRVLARDPAVEKDVGFFLGLFEAQLEHSDSYLCVALFHY